jgi:lambda family phage minor tail protein L
MSELNKNLQSVNPNPIIELFEIQLKTALHGANTTYRFHNNTNVTTSQGNISWNSNTYYSAPIQASGFKYETKQTPRPTLAISNLSLLAPSVPIGIMSSILKEVNTTTVGNDLVGAAVTRIRTLAKFLPNSNFTGTNPYGDSNTIGDFTQEFPKEIYEIARKSKETRDLCTFELAASIDQFGVKLPKRQYLPDEFKGIGDFFN